MARVKIIFKDRYKRVDVQNIAIRNGCKLIYAAGDEATYEIDNPDAFVSELKILEEMSPSIEIILL
jgi:hypothetical protein